MTDGSSGGALRFEILGPVRAFRGGDPVDLGPVVQRAVFALLLLHAGKPVPVRQIVAALWDGDPPENGVDVVQRCVGGLRRALDPERTSLLALTDSGYVLRVDGNAVDAEVFRAGLAKARTEHQTGNLGAATGEVRRALGLWQDEPLAGLTGSVFESARARLNEERATASQLLAAPAPAEPAAAKPTYPEPAPAKPADPEPAAAKPADPEPVAVKPAYPEAVDPWAGHDLFPPDPLSMV